MLVDLISEKHTIFCSVKEFWAAPAVPVAALRFRSSQSKRNWERLSWDLTPGPFAKHPCGAPTGEGSRGADLHI